MKPKIDISRYPTEKISQQIGELLCVSRSIRTVLFVTGCSVCALIVANYIVSAHGTKATLPWMVCSIYGLGLAVAVGFLLGILRIARDWMQRADLLLSCTLDASRIVAKDYAMICADEKSMPSVGEILREVYSKMVTPVIETTVARSVGIFAWPILSVYRRTLGVGIEFLITCISDDDDPPISADHTNESNCDSPQPSSDFAEDYLTRFEKSVNSASQFTESVRTRLRYLIRPLEVIAGTVAISGLVPLAIGWASIS